MQETYRHAASIVLLRPLESGGHQVLLLHKPRKRDAWQLPQGGVEEGETAEVCALRELEEEAGIRSVKIMGESTTVYQYDFPTSYRKFRPDHIRGQRIEFVFAQCPPDTTVQVDGKEVDRYQWVQDRQLSLFIKRKEYLDVVRSLLREAARIPRS